MLGAGDVTSKTEGKAFADATGVPLLVKYDTRIRDGVAKGVVQDVTEGIEVRLLAKILKGMGFELVATKPAAWAGRGGSFRW